MIAVDSEHLGALAAILKERVGLHVRADGMQALRLALLARLEELEDSIGSTEAYLRLFDTDEGDDELRRLLPLVTVGKTSFFRDDRQFGALRALLPGLLARPKSGGRPLAIWSAGCATGEEPYSLAMSIAEAGGAPEDVELIATDVNPEAVAAAARGSYDARRVKEIPEPLREEWWDREGERYVARAGLRRYIGAIRPHNLVSSIFPRPSASQGWDLIFCRNVIIYFDTATTQQVLAQFHQALLPGGYLFLGYSESLFRLFDGFELTEVAGAFLYRRPERGVRVGPPLPPGPPRAMLPVSSSPPSVTHVHVGEEPRGTGSAAAETARLRPGARKPAPAEPEPLAPQEFLDGAVALFADGRFGAARELLERLLEQGGEDLAVRLTLANLYGILRQPDKAGECYAAALALEPLCAEAHLFYGIHLHGQADHVGAARELQRALFLDPDLALAHYYLGRSFEGQKDAQRARLAYKNALDSFRRRPDGKRQAFLGYYPDVPEDGTTFARAAEYALAAL